MSNEKCIPIKKELISYMSAHFPNFIFQGNVGAFYAFRKLNDNGIYDHIIIQREFWEGTISLVITEVASCYNSNWRGIPWFTVGLGTDIGVLITGKSPYPVNTGWHRCNNRKEELETIFTALGADIETYVLPFFFSSHNKINVDKLMVVTNTYIQAQLATLSEEEIVSLKQYLTDCNKAYSEYRKMCIKNNQKEEIAYWDIISLHPLIEQWLLNIKNQLNYSHLCQSIRINLINYSTILFRDTFDFYNLK